MINTEPNIIDIKLKIIESLQKSGWDANLKTFTKSEDFDKIFQTLLNLRNESYRFTPPVKEIFKAFTDCPFENTRVVIIGNNPYPTIGQANGVAYCCEKSDRMQIPLKRILESIYRTIYPEKKIPIKLDMSLRKWSDQGVLLINMALTCQLERPDSHLYIWKDFIIHLVDMLNYKKEKLIFLLLGENAKDLKDIIDIEKHHVICASDPSIANKGDKGQWDNLDCFNEINKTLTKKIKW